MSIISFLQDAGEKLFGHATPGAAPAATAPAPSSAPAAAATPDPAALNAAAGTAIQNYIGTQSLSVENLKVTFDGASRTATVEGVAADQATKEKVVLCCGNVHSVAKVDDQLTVAAPAEPPATYREVKSGDTLSRIAKEAYGDANAYMRIFDANKPMLASPDKIYPGQMLRIPAAA